MFVYLSTCSASTGNGAGECGQRRGGQVRDVKWWVGQRGNGEGLGISGKMLKKLGTFKLAPWGRDESRDNYLKMGGRSPCGGELRGGRRLKTILGNPTFAGLDFISVRTQLGQESQGAAQRQLFVIVISSGRCCLWVPAGHLAYEISILLSAPLMDGYTEPLRGEAGALRRSLSLCGFFSPGGIQASHPEAGSQVRFPLGILPGSSLILRNPGAVKRNFLGIGQPGVTFQARLHHCPNPSLSPCSVAE